MPPISLIFFWTLIAYSFFDAFFPRLHPLVFSAFLAQVSLFSPLSQTLLWAFFSGLALDLLSSQTHFGFEALLFVITLCILYPWRRLFFYDKPHAIILYTALIACASTLIKSLFLAIFYTLPPFSWRGICTEFIFMPLCDGIVGFFWFTCPLILIKLVRKTVRLWKHP